MPKRRKVKKQKIAGSLRRLTKTVTASENMPVDAVSNEGFQEKSILQDIFLYPVELIKRDILKSLALAFVAFVVLIILTAYFG